MAWLDSLKTLINNLEEKQFYIYIGSFVSAIFLGILLGIVLFYKNVSFYKKNIARLNEQREDIKSVLQRNFRVEQQQTKINQLLQENENFKIGGFFEDLLAKLQLTNNKESTRPLTSTDTGSREYRESALEARLVNITMQQLCILLNEIHNNKLVYTKEVDITKSKRTPRTIDVTLTIATLQRITENLEATE